MERFFGTLKSEWTPKLGYENIIDADYDLHHYVYNYYNPCRPHTYNNGLSPDAAEAAYYSPRVVAVVN